MSTLEFYLTRAAECERDAEATSLVNVRERHMRARHAWLAMAEKLELTTTARAKTAAEKAAALSEQAALSEPAILN